MMCIKGVVGGRVPTPRSQNKLENYILTVLPKMKRLLPNSLKIIVIAPKLPISEAWSSQGFLGAGEKGHLFSGSLGAITIIFKELGSKRWVCSHT